MFGQQTHKETEMDIGDVLENVKREENNLSGSLTIEKMIVTSIGARLIRWLRALSSGDSL